MCYIKDICKYEGQSITIRGWVYNRRRSGRVLFLVLRDGTGLVQVVVVREDVGEEVFRLCDTIAYESSVILTGKVREERRAPGGYEIAFERLKVLSVADDYPISLKEHGVDFLLEHRHLWLRSRRPYATMRIRATCIKAITDFFDNRGFTRVDAPLFTPSACEGTTTLFQIPYFGKKAYLSQSGQLYMEAACMALGRVYCFGPSFRAEQSKTRRHLTEFWQVEPEIAYATLSDVMDLSEELVQSIVIQVLGKNREELEILKRDTRPLELITRPFERISYTEAVKRVGMKWGGDFGAGEETKLSESFKKPVLVTGYPQGVKPFYMKRDPEDEKIVLNFDMLAPEGYGEIIGGAEREDDLKTLLERVREYNLREDDYKWYIDLRRYGTCPHAGFGLGLERTVAWICGIRHIRETIPFPRTIDRLYP
ncbi:asparagine--tRNA ligase [candidate division WOR-3 bacterium]|nr:asparagine--tRNA ligase [candidate division WOR-3 bacterium]